MAFVADQQNRVTLLGEAHRLHVDLGNKRAGRVDGPETPAGARLADGWSNAVSAVKDGRAFGNFLDAIDEDDTALCEPLDHGPVVNDFVVDVKWSPKESQRPVQAFDRHVNAGAEAAGVGEDKFH